MHFPNSFKNKNKISKRRIISYFFHLNESVLKSENSNKTYTGKAGGCNSNATLFHTNIPVFVSCYVIPLERNLDWHINRRTHFMAPNTQKVKMRICLKTFKMLRIVCLHHSKFKYLTAVVFNTSTRNG